MRTNQFIINGVPFSGTGFGYQPSSGQLNRIYDSVNKVYGPAPIAPDKTHWPTPLLPNDLDNRIPLGGANPDYTAADFQHVLLAAQVYNTVSSTTQTLPSMHRPALINYWINNQTAATWHGLWTANPDLCRRIMMRPIGTMNGIATTDNPDHPNFTGSNPNSNGFDPINGPWDVDNAGTGVPDSVWVDLGMPVRSSSDGRLYKPLFAILCVDLDGRINLNAHGSLAQAAGGSPVTSSGGAASFAGGGAPAPADWGSARRKSAPNTSSTETRPSTNSY